MKIIIFLISIIILLANHSYAKKKILVGIFNFNNHTKNKELSYIGLYVQHSILSLLKQNNNLDPKKLGNLPKSLKQNKLPKRYYYFNYLITGEYKLENNNLILLKIFIYDIKDDQEPIIIKRHFFLPLKEHAINEVKLLSQNVLWSVIGIPFQIFSNPSDSEVYINKKYIGRTPLKNLRGTKEKHNIIIYKKGYKIINTSIELKKSNQNIFLFPLEIQKFSKSKSKLSIKYAYSFIFDNYTEVDPIVPLLFSYEYFIKDLSFEIETGIINFYRNTEVKNINGLVDRKTITLIPLTFAVKYHFFQNFHISPYLGIGGGALFVSVTENSSPIINPLFFFVLGANVGFIRLNDTSRLGFFIEGRYFIGGKVTVGESSFNFYGAPTRSETQIEIKGFNIMGGLSYIFF